MRTVKESLATFTNIFKFGQKKTFNKKLITIKILLDEILVKAETMFSLTEILNKNHQKDMDDIKRQFEEHISRIRTLQDQVNDFTFQSLMSSYAPVLKTQLNSTIGNKTSPISIFLRKFSPDAENQIFLSEIWEEKTMKECKYVVSELQICSDELKEFIKQNIGLEDVLSYQHR